MRWAGTARPKFDSAPNRMTTNVAPAKENSADDEVLMARFAAGEAEAFDELYARHHLALYGFCVRLVGDAADAQDAFQDIFLKVIENRSEYRPQGRFRSWLFTIAHHTCTQRMRTARRREGLRSVRLAGTPVDTVTPLQTAVTRDEIARLLRSLSPGQRETLLLHRYEGFSYQEIAKMTGSTTAAVKQQAYRALLTLRSQSKS